MSQSTNMACLTGEIRQAAQSRKSAIGDMRGAVKSTLATCATMRGEMSRDYHEMSRDYRAETQKWARNLRASTVQSMLSMAAAIEKMAKRQRTSLRAGCRKLRTDMGGLLGAMHADRMEARKMWSNSRFAGADKAPAALKGRRKPAAPL